MDSAPPRTVLRDRSNNNGNTAKALISGFIDHPEGAQHKPTLSSPGSTAGNVDGKVDVGKAAAAAASHRAAASATPAVRIVTPESFHPGADTSTTSYRSLSTKALRTATVIVQQQQYRRAVYTATAANTPASAPPAPAHAASDAAAAAEAPLDHSRRHHSSRNVSSTSTSKQPPPPVACTLVAFEPGSLGLELEAIVDQDAGGREESGVQQRHGRRRRSRRLGCRVFRVTPEGQADRHGSVHPGDALVVLDG